MYQRLGRVVVVSAVSLIFLWLSTSDTEHEGNGDPDDLIREQEENRSDRHHHEYHGGCDHGLLARRPGDLAGLLAHFLQETERADPRLTSHFCRRLIAHLFTLSPAVSRLAGVAGLEPATPGFGDRCSTN